jgi:hypothetical protein
VPRGGRREGAGRPIGSRNRVPADARAKFRAFLDANLDEILDDLRRTRDPRVKLEVVRLAASYALGKPREALDVRHDLNPFQSFLDRLAVERIGAVTVESEPAALLPEATE